MQAKPTNVKRNAPFSNPYPPLIDETVIPGTRFGPSEQELLLQGYRTPQTAFVRRAQSENELQMRIKCRATLARMQKKIQDYAVAGRLGLANHERRRLFGSHAARVTAASRELRHYRSKHPISACPTLDELVALMDDRAACYHVYVEMKLKRDGRHRPICAYCLVDRALQRTLELSFGAGITYLENQAGVKRKGMKSLLRLIDRSIRSGQYKYAAEVDINSYFSNLNPETIGERFGMKAGIIDRVLTNRDKERSDKISPRNRDTYRKWNSVEEHVERGLPQGSVASPTFAWAMLVPILQAFKTRYGSRVVIFNYCDNFLILGPSEVTVQHAVEFLSEQLKLLAERLTLKHVTGIRQLAHGIEFAGYRFIRRNGSPIVSIPIAKQRAFLNELDRRLADVQDETNIDSCLAWIMGKLAYFEPDPGAVTRLIRSTFIKTKALQKRHPALAQALLPLYSFMLRKFPEDEKVEQAIIGIKRPRVRRRTTRRLNFGPTIPRNFRIKEPVFDDLFKQRNRDFVARHLTSREAFVSDFNRAPFSAHIGDYLLQRERQGLALR